MVLLDLEAVLLDYSERIKNYDIYLPGDLITTTPGIFKTSIDTSSSIFRILILGETNITYTYSYSKVNPKDYFTQLYYLTDYYIPDSSGDNILSLTSNDIQYIDEINQNITPTVTPDSDFLLAHYNVSYVPTTTLGMIIKLVKSIEEYISIAPNYIPSL